MNCEIFSKNENYFKILLNGFCRLGKLEDKCEKITEEKFRSKYEQKIQEVLDSKDKEKVNKLDKFINNRYLEEKEITNVLEKKALALFGQMGIVVTLLLSVISFSTPHYDFLPCCLRIITWFFLIFIILNFVTAILYAKKVVSVTLYGFHHHTIESFFMPNNTTLENMLETYSMSEFNHCLNKNKVKYLSYSQKFIVVGFVLIVLITFLVSILSIIKL